MDPVSRCGRVFTTWPIVTCDEPQGHPGGHTGRDPDGVRWAWTNDDD